MRLPTPLPGHTHAAAFVHVSHLMGGVHQRGGRRAAHRAAHRGAVGPERSGRSILKLTSLCRCAGPQEAAFCVLRAMRHRGCYGISGRVFEHRVGFFVSFDRDARYSARTRPPGTRRHRRPLLAAPLSSSAPAVQQRSPQEQDRHKAYAMASSVPSSSCSEGASPPVTPRPPRPTPRPRPPRPPPTSTPAGRGAPVTRRLSPRGWQGSCPWRGARAVAARRSSA